MSDSWRLDWVTEKTQIAKKLYAGECGGSYPEAAIILSSVLSALAAEVWPGRRKDAKRFVELLIKHTPSSLGSATVSIPLLLDTLRTTTPLAQEAELIRAFMPTSDSRVLTGDDIDRQEHAVKAACPNIPLNVVRRHSYAYLFYEEVRSGYVHEYRIGARGDSWAMGDRRQAAHVSYTNRLNADRQTIRRLIFFNVDWLSALATTAAEVLDRLPADFPDENFDQWWIDEA